jgi:DNA-binding transcriptional ArsR family regulator
MQLDAFQVIADPVRRRILASLRDGERPVNDVVKELDIHQSGVSRHLRILLATGFVQMRAEGQRRLYSLRADPFRELESWLGAYRELWEARLDRFERALDQKQRAKKNVPNKKELL